MRNRRLTRLCRGPKPHRKTPCSETWWGMTNRFDSHRAAGEGRRTAAGDRIPAKGGDAPAAQKGEGGGNSGRRRRSAATARDPRTHHEDGPSLPSVHCDPRGPVVHDRMPRPRSCRGGGPRSGGLAGYRYGSHGIPSTIPTIGTTFSSECGTERITPSPTCTFVRLES